jgi:hypothetical protein
MQTYVSNYTGIREDPSTTLHQPISKKKKKNRTVTHSWASTINTLLDKIKQ